MILLFRMVSKDDAKVFSCIPKYEKVHCALQGEKCVLDKLPSGGSCSVGHALRVQQLVSNKVSSHKNTRETRPGVSPSTADGTLTCRNLILYFL